MSVRLHRHAKERLNERGATEDEVIVTIETGETFPASLDEQVLEGISPMVSGGKVRFMLPSKSKCTLLKRMKTGLPLRL
jgi:hypothetical protein